MSLDVCLYKINKRPAEKVILEDADGGTQEFYAEDWPHELPTVISRDVLFEANITHNLNTMAAQVNIYEYLWRPGEIGVTCAGELIKPLAEGISFLESDPKRFKAFDAENGWGTYDDFVPWIKRYLEACKEHPTAFVESDR